MGCDEGCRTGGVGRLHTDAATITPAANPVIARWTFIPGERFRKNTQPAPATVPANGISNPQMTSFIFSSGRFRRVNAGPAYAIRSSFFPYRHNIPPVPGKTSRDSRFFARKPTGNEQSCHTMSKPKTALNFRNISILIKFFLKKSRKKGKRVEKRVAGCIVFIPVCIATNCGDCRAFQCTNRTYDRENRSMTSGSFRHGIEHYTTNRSTKMKVTSSIKRRCENCQIIKRKGVVRVVCSRNPRHKQKQG